MDRISEIAMHFLVNAAWQIAAVAIGASICARLLRNAAARYRNLLWSASLVLSLALPLWGLFDLDSQTVQQFHASAQRADAGPAPDDLSATSALTLSPAVTGVAVTDSLRILDLLHTRRQYVAASSNLALAFALCYALFILYRLIGLWRGWLAAQRFRRSASVRELPRPLAAVSLRCRDAFNLNRIPIMFSARAATPATIGASKPVIILPESFRETSEETLGTILGHEMAHIARRDFALNLVYEFLRLPISFHPLANFLKRQIDRTRELACDDMVTERLIDPDVYARSLIRVASALVLPAGQALTLGVFDADILEERIMKLTKTTGRLGAGAARLAALCAFSLLCLTCVAISTFSFDLRMDGASERSSLIATTQSSDETGTRTAEARSPGQSESHAQNQGTPLLTRAEWESSLNSADAQERAAAACSAGKNHTVEAIPMLVAILGDDTPTQPLRCWEGGRWSPALESFKLASPGEQAAIALASMGIRALEPLTNALSDPSASVRRNAAWGIGELTNMREDDRANSVPPLIVLLDDADEWVRMAAARALGEIRDERATEGLIAQLADRQWQVRKLAAWALGEMKESRAVEGLCKVLLSDAKSEVRVTTAWALGEVQDKRAVDTLCNALVWDKESEVRRTTAWALGEIQSRKAVSFLKQALSDPDERVRAKVYWALSEIER